MSSWRKGLYVPQMGKIATAAAVAVGVVGALAVTAVDTQPDPSVRPIDQLALVDGDHDRLIVLDVPSQYEELAQMLVSPDADVGFSTPSVDSDGVQISAQNHWLATELPSVRALSDADGNLEIEPFASAVHAVRQADSNTNVQPEGVPHRGIFAHQNYVFAEASLTVPGLPGDVMVTGDWDGDGEETPGVFRPVEFSPFSTLQGVFSATDGEGELEQPQIYIDAAEDVSPLVGDWDGDGLDSLAIRHHNTEPFTPDLIEFFDADGNQVAELVEISSHGVVVVGGYDVAARFVRLRSSR